MGPKPASTQGLAATLFLLTLPAILSAQSVGITTTTIQCQGGIANGPDNALWCTQGFGIARVSTAGVLTTYPLPNNLYSGGAITRGPDSALWFTTETNIGRITTAGAITLFPLPSLTYSNSSITAGPDGNLWFTAQTNGLTTPTASIGRITTAGVATYFSVTSSSVGSITAGSDGALWFLTADNSIGRITTTGNVTMFPLQPPTGFGYGNAIASGSDGALWFINSQNGVARIGRITTAGVVTEYAIPSGMPASQIAPGPDGALWFTEDAGLTYTGAIGRISTSGAITEYPILGSAPGGPYGIVTGPDGALWLTGVSGAYVGRAFLTTGNITVTTRPVGPAFSVDGVTYEGAVSFNWAPGERHTIGTVSPQIAGNPSTGGSNARLAFSNWSDGGAQTHQITVPSTPTVYTAMLSLQYPLAITVQPPTAGIVQANPPSPDGYYDAYTDVQLTAIPNPSYQFINWSSDLAGSTNPESIVVNYAHVVQANFTQPASTIGYSQYVYHGGELVGGITAGPDGALWFPVAFPNHIGRIGTTGVITMFPLGPFQGFDPDDITTGSDAALWFTEGIAKKIGRITTDGQISHFSVSGTAYHITGGADGALWFAEGDSIGRITTAGVLTEMTIPGASNLQGITKGPDGALWFADFSARKIGRITTAGAVTFPVAGTTSFPGTMVAGPDGALWFAGSSPFTIGRVTTSGAVTEYQVNQSPGDYTTGLTVGPDGALWFNNGGVGRITTSGAITFPVAFSPAPTINLRSGITTGPDGALWLVGYFGIARLLIGGVNQGPPPSGAASQSSTLPGTAPASAAYDGNTDGNFLHGSVTATNLENNPWWQIDLGTSQNVGSVVVWNRTDCCADRLTNYWVFVSNTPFLATDTPATLQNRAGTFAGHQTLSPNPSTTIAVGAQGRYVRVQLDGTNYLSLAEVQILTGTGPQAPTASQSSTLPGTPPASAAIDGNTFGYFPFGSVTATGLDSNAWWQEDLGTSATIGSLVIWNRTDCCADRLSNYWVFVSNTPFLATDTPATLQNRAGTFASHQTSAPNPSATIAVGMQARYIRVQLDGTNYLSLAEVQVSSTIPQTNVAQAKPASQSSTLPGAPVPGVAIDGNTNGSFFTGSVTATNLENNPWWQVDLGTSTAISSVVVWNRTDCCADRLSDYWVFISDTPFTPNDTPATLQQRAATFASHQTSAPNPSTTIPAVTQGRYVRIQLSSPNYLSLAEVQVFGVPSIGPPQKVATQSSTLPNTPPASAAIDGNTDGNFAHGSVTATGSDIFAWWEVDLGASQTVNSVTIWNRTDCCASRLSDFWVFASNTPFTAAETPITLASRSGTFSSHQTTAPNPSVTIPVGMQARYIRVQLSGTNYLSLAEVQVQ